MARVIVVLSAVELVDSETKEKKSIICKADRTTTALMNEHFRRHEVDLAAQEKARYQVRSLLGLNKESSQEASSFLDSMFGGGAGGSGGSGGVGDQASATEGKENKQQQQDGSDALTTTAATNGDKMDVDDVKKKPTTTAMETESMKSVSLTLEEEEEREQKEIHRKKAEKDKAFLDVRRFGFLPRIITHLLLIDSLTHSLAQSLTRSCTQLRTHTHTNTHTHTHKHTHTHSLTHTTAPAELGDSRAAPSQVPRGE